MAERFVWTHPDGSVIDMTDSAAGYSVLANGTRGLRSVEWNLTADHYAGMDGSRVQAIRALENTPSIGMLLEAPDEATFITRQRNMVRAMRPRLNGKVAPGNLTVYRGDGTSRSLTCSVIDGMAGDESVDTQLPGRWWKLALKLYAEDPWWYGAPVTTSFGLAVPSVFLSTTLPMPRALSSSSIQGQATVDLSASDDPTSGLWTITGPGVGLTLTRQLLLPDGTVDPDPNSTKTLSSSASIPDGGTVVIRTRRGEQSIRRGDGTNLGGTLAAGSTFWPLAEGVNRITVLLGGAGANSSVQLVYSPKYGGI